MFCRVGEAHNAGPTEAGEDTEFVIGCLNPTGVLGKAAMCDELPGAHAIWGISETHLSQAGIVKFRKEVHHSSPKFKFHPGYPTPLRAHAPGAIGGTHKGVGFLATCPGRSLPAPWDTKVWQSCRAHTGTFKMGQQWVTVGVCYGFAYKANTIATQSQTNELLQELTKRVVQGAVGPRVILGDFNQEYGVLQQCREWEELGWVEIQQYAKQAWHQEKMPTCKHSTCKDQVWISPELRGQLQEVRIDGSYFADHAVLWGTFRGLGRPSPTPVWPSPKPMPEPHATVKEYVVLPVQADDVSQYYSAIVSAYEDAVHQDQLHHTGVGLHPSQRGRAQRTEVQWITQQVAPQKCARLGEFQAKFHGRHLGHTRMLRQIRRLQSLEKLVGSVKWNSTVLEHRLGLWKAIQKAPGFTGGFTRWCTVQYALQRPSLIPVPDVIPSQHYVAELREALQGTFDRLEKALLKDRAAEARQARLANPALIFRDLQRPKAEAVQTLLATHHATVTSTSAETGVVEFHPPGALKPGAPVFSATGLVQVERLEQGSLTSEGPSLPQVGATLVQEEPIADRQAIFEAFSAEWEARWDKHKQIPESRWTPFTEWVRNQVPKPKGTMPLPDITVSHWKSEIKRKKGKTASGLDGISREDLLNMPDSIHACLISVLHKVEQGCPWPTACMQGVIAALQKEPDAKWVNAFRPITVLALPYRCWASLRCKQLIRWITRHAPDTLIGNRPGKSTTDLWFAIQAQIEEQHYEGGEMAGVLTDIVKCYNMIPRIPTLELALHLGVHPALVRAWGSALVQVERRFRVTGGVSPPLRSTTGFPEGCSLSVCSMLMINVACTYLIEQRSPDSTYWSYVDNLEATGPSKASVVSSLSAMREVCNALDLALDEKKTYMWSTSAQTRKELREEGYQVTLQLRDIGGHMQYCRRKTNSTLTQRIEALAPLWGQLARSLAPLRRKETALITVAWPRAFQGIAAIHLGETWYQMLRSGAMKGMGLAHAGTSPLAQLSLVQDARCDPEYFAINLTVKTYRKHSEPDQAYPLLDRLSSEPPLHYAPGPTGVLLTRLHALGWSWQGGGWFHDQEGNPLHLRDTPVQELSTRLLQAWQVEIGCRLAKRKGFEGASRVCVRTSKRGWDALTPTQQGFLRVVHNGSYYTQDRHAKTGYAKTAECKWCTSEDSVQHRLWECPATAAFRADLPEGLRSEISKEPKCTQEHAWFCEPQEARTYRRLLHTIKPHGSVRWDSPELPEVLHLFTDGSCRSPADARCRIASWSLILALPEQDQFWPLSYGLVPGQHQTGGRGELIAAIQAFRFAEARHKSFCLWTDYERVVRLLEAWEWQCETPPHWKPDHDLQQELFLRYKLAVQQGRFIKVVHVTSHLNPLHLSTAVEHWARRGNEAADQWANHAIQEAPDALKEARQDLKTALQRLDWMQDALKSLHLRVANFAVGSKQGDDAERPPPADRRPQGEASEDQPYALPRLREGLSQVHAPLNAIEDERLQRWLRSLEAPQSEGRWLTWHQLVIDYQLQTESEGPWQRKGSKQWHQGETWRRELQDYSLQNAAKFFRQYVTEHARRVNEKPHTKFCLPDGAAYQQWATCMWLPLSAQRWAQLEAFLRHHAVRARAIGKMFRQTPCAVGWKPPTRARQREEAARQEPHQGDGGAEPSDRDTTN